MNRKKPNRRFKLYGICLAFAILAAGALYSLESRTYMGATGCAECHQREYELWLKGPHAKSFDSLAENRKQDITCLWCHATDARENFKSFKLSGVQCEACHGAGGRSSMGVKTENFSALHKSRLKTQDETVCLECHSKERTPEIGTFNYEEKKKLIKHW